MPRMECFDRIQ